VCLLCCKGVVSNAEISKAQFVLILLVIEAHKSHKLSRQGREQKTM
jgi:hypothetical protein